MKKLFDFDARKGSFIEKVSGVVGSATGCKFVTKEKGVCLTQILGSDIVNFGNLPNLNFSTSTDFTIRFIVKTTYSGTYRDFFMKRWSGADSNTIFWAIGLFNGQIYTGLNDGTNSYGLFSDSILVNNNRFFEGIITYDRDGNCSIYINNQLANTASMTSILDISNNNDVQIFRALDIEMDVALIQVYEGIPTSTERSNLYRDFLSSTNIEPPVRNFYYPKPTSLNETGLVAAYNMIPSPGQTLVDISGNGNNGTITGAISTKDGMKFDGVDDYISLGNPVLSSNPFSISMRFNSLDASNNVIYGEGYSSSISPRFLLRSDANKKLNMVILNDAAATLVSQATDSVVFDGLDHDIIITCNNGDTKIYIDGVEDTNSASNLFNFTYSTTTLNKSTLSALERTSFSNHCPSEIKDFKAYNKILSLQEIKDYHNSFAKQVVLNEKFDYPVGWTI